MIRQHHTAAKARMEANALLAGKVEDAVRLDSTGTKPAQGNYVVLKTALPLFTDPRLADTQAIDLDQLVECSVRVVAVDLNGLYLLMDAVNAQMLGHRLAVAGRALTAFERTEFDEPDYDFTARVHFQDVLFEATSSRPAA